MSNRSSRAPPPPRAAPGARSVRFNMEGGEKLKNIGNELFKQGKHVEAIAKYTESANAYPMNPVVYANRAAAHLATKEYIDAVFDCEKATKLDPTYAKAWARLGTALYELFSWDECSNAWNKALEHLSKPTLTPSELALKIQVEDGLKLAQEGSLKNAASAKLAPVGRSPGLTHDTSPCIRAAALTWRKEREIQACKTPSPIPPSCVFTLNYANACLSAANRMLNILAHAPAGEGLFAMATSGAVFENLTSAILLDERVFHVEAPHELYGKLAKQYFLESLGGKSLVEGGGLDNIKKEVLKRLQEQDWESEVAPVVSLTVRYWIFQAHWRFYLYGPTFFSYLLYTRVVEFLEWGRDHWPDSSESVICGGTFREDMFRGVMRLRLQTMQALLGTKPPDDLEHLFTMNDLIADAHELIDATNAHEFPKSSSGLPIGQVAAFWSHTIVHAHGALGWAHFCAGRSGWLDERYKDKAREHFKHASNYYLQAMAGCPKDDPKYAYFVRMQIECRCYGLRPLREILPACTHLLRMVPKALEIWATPHEGGIALVNIKAQVEQFQEWCEKEVTEGRMRVDKTDRFILPTEFVYVDISKAKWPFEPLMWRREREEEEDRGADVESPGHDDET